MSCWFCSIRDEEADHHLAYEMYGEVDAQETKAQTKVAYKVQHVKVPRCADCHSRHTIAQYIDIIAIILGAIFLLSILFAVFGWVAQWIWALWMGLSFGLMLGSLAAHVLVLRGIHSVYKARMTFPEIKELLEKCFRFGYRPRGQVIESDPTCNPAEKTQVTPK